MDGSPPPTAPGRRVSIMVERKLDELCASIEGALTTTHHGPPDTEKRLVADIKKRIDFLKCLLVAEGECSGGGGVAPAYLVEAEARFAVLDDAFEQWARRVVGGSPAAEEGQPDEEEDEGGRSRSECSCTDSCQEAGGAEVDGDPVAAVEATPPVVVTSDGATDRKRDSVVITEEEVTPEPVAAVAKKPDAAVVPREEEVTVESDAKKNGDAEHQDDAAETKTSSVQRRWWRRSAAWCGAAGVVAVVAVALAVELAAVAHSNVHVYAVPT